MKEIVAEIFKGMDEKLISEDLKAKVTAMINNIVEARTNAKTAEALEKAKKLEEENTAIKAEIEAVKKDVTEKEEYLKECAVELGKKMAQEFSEKEATLFESLKEYQETAIAVLKETAAEHRDMIESIAVEEGTNLKAFYEQESLEAAAEFKKMREAADAEKLTKFKEDLLEKIDEYIRGELQKNIPQNIMEAAAEAAALKPIVESVIAIIEKNGLKIDKSGYEALSEAKSANTKLSDALNVKVTENVKLEARVKDLEKKVKLAQLTEGMTINQKAKATKLLESSSVENLENNFKAVKDMIVEESTKAPVRVSKIDFGQQKVAADVTKARVEKIVESIDKLVGKTDEMDVWATNLDRMRRQ